MGAARGARVEGALLAVKQLREQGKEQPRASTTDSDARVMKMPDGGHRPGYNIQMATAGSPLGGPRTIVGVQVTNVGSDMGSASPMLDQIERRTGALPKVLLAERQSRQTRVCRALRIARRRGLDSHPRALSERRPKRRSNPRHRRLAGAHEDRPRKAAANERGRLCASPMRT